jgi:hypothetical protein
MVFDLETREMIWADLSLPTNSGRSINVGNNNSGITLMCKSIVNIKKPNLFDLFMLHSVRGTIVDKPEDADTVFSVETGITPFDVDVIMAKYL